MWVFAVVKLEKLVNDDSNDDRKYEEQRGVKHNGSGLALRILKSDNDSQYDDTDNIVDDRCAHDGLADFI